MNGLKYIRNLCNMSLSELAEKLNVSRQAISMWEREDEKKKPIPKKRLEQLSQLFGISDEYFNDLTQAQKSIIDNKRIFCKYGQNGRVYILSDDKPVTDQNEALCEYIIDKNDRDFYEEYNKLNSDVKILMKQITDFILSKGEDIGIYDQIGKMYRMLNLYGALTNVAKTQKGFIYSSVAYQIIKALEITFDVCDLKQYDLEIKEGQGRSYAGEWTYKIAQIFKDEIKRLEQEKSDRINAIKEKRKQ